MPEFTNFSFTFDDFASLLWHKVNFRKHIEHFLPGERVLIKAKTDRHKVVKINN